MAVDSGDGSWTESYQRGPGRCVRPTEPSSGPHSYCLETASGTKPEAALYGPARLLEKWQQRHQSIGNRGASEAETDATLVEQTPDLEEYLTDAEKLFTGMM